MKNVIHLRRVHELEPHVRPEPALMRDVRLFWAGVDWFWFWTAVVGGIAGVLTIVCGMLALASVVDPDDLEHVLSVIGGAL